MPNPYFEQALKISVAGAVAEARSAVQLDHPYLKGKLREISIAGLLEPLLTGRNDVGSGKCTDSNGNLSSELDLIIYGCDINPPMVYDESGFGLYPCESVLAAIEVKSTLSASELKKALKNLASTSSNHLEFLSGRYDESGTKTVEHGYIEIFRCLLRLTPISLIR